METAIAANQSELLRAMQKPWRNERCAAGIIGFERVGHS